MKFRLIVLAVAGVLGLSSVSSMALAALMPPMPTPPAMSKPLFSGGWYFGAFGGPSYVPDTAGFEFKAPEWQVGGQAGYKIGPLRMEGEFLYLNDKFEDFPIKLEGYAGMFNAMFDLQNDVMPILPYLGAGIGGIHFRGTINNDSTFTVTNSEDELALQGIIGASVPMTDSISLFADYRYLATPGDAFNNDEHYQTHTANFGANFWFDR